MVRSVAMTILILGLASASPPPATAETIQLAATLSGSAEVPPKTTDGKGTATASIDTATKALTYSIEYNGLTGAATAAHFHGPAEPGANAGVVLPFPTPASPIKGTATLTDAQMADLMAGKWYANIHTAANPGGEIRGQLVRAQ